MKQSLQVTGLGAWAPSSLGPRAWGRGLQRLGLGPGQGLGAQATRVGPDVRPPDPKSPLFRRSEKSPGGRQAKGWATGQTCEAEARREEATVLTGR